MCGGHAPYPTNMPFGVSSGITNVIIHAKFHVDRLRGFWPAGPPKVQFPILIGTTLRTVLHYHADCDDVGIPQPQSVTVVDVGLSDHHLLGGHTLGRILIY